MFIFFASVAGVMVSSGSPLFGCLGWQKQMQIVLLDFNYIAHEFYVKRTKSWSSRSYSFQDEFLLNAPSALGMFATSSGISQRPPLQWSDNLVSVVYTHPYILALNDEFVTIHR